MNPTTSRLTTLLGTASILTMANAIAAQAGEAQVAAAAPVPVEIPEQVLITGSLIRGTAAVGVPVTNLAPQDFAMTGALTTSDLFRTFPAANVSPGPTATQSGANIERGSRVNLRQLDTGNAARTLMMVDGVRFPPQGNGLCAIDPSIVPSLSLDRIDVLVDGASATYGADAVSGVINIVLRRGFEGAITQMRYSTAEGGMARYAASQLWGRSWDGGNVTVSYEWYEEQPMLGGVHSNFTVNFSPWGLDNRLPLSSSLPGTISTGAPAPTKGNYPGSRGTNCTNCFAIPGGTGGDWVPGAIGTGPTSPFSASTLNWTTFAVGANSGTNGTRNEFNAYDLAWETAFNTRNGGHIAIDQRLTRNISFFGTAFYSNRRARFINPSTLSPAQNNAVTVAVPTWNPYYPTGGAPTNLRVSYNLGLEKPSVTSAYELAGRYQFGLNIELPGDWSGQVFMAQTYDSNSSFVKGTANPNATSAALGWTILATPAAGSAPGFANWVKPSALPYLNLFCDPRVFSCNSPDTLNYINGVNRRYEVMQINNKTATFSGPVIDLPGGPLRAAVGFTYESAHFQFQQLDNTGSPSLLSPFLFDNINRNLWAAYTQLNIPIFSEMNAIPFFDRLEIEGSWRHDQYSDFGGTSNQKLAFNWTPSVDIGVTIRGAWGTSFRAPSFGELSPLTNTAIACQNVPSNPGCNQTTITLNCSPTSSAPVGSGAWKLFPGTCAAGGLIYSGVSHNGGVAAPVAAGLRAAGTLNAGRDVLKPEQATNWAFGGEFAPTNFLQGLDIQATWYKIKITSVLQSFGNPGTTSFNEPSRGFTVLVPSDFAGVSGNANCATSNLAPTTCSAFLAAATALMSNPRSAIDPTLATSVYWINDGGSFNVGWLTVEGIDWNASYDWDMGDLGAFNVGVVGTYYLHNKSQNFPSDPIQDSFHTTLVGGAVHESRGVESLPRMRYRARMGWASGPWSVTGFMDYQGHFFHTQGAPPNVNGNFCQSNGVSGGGTFPCAISNYTNIEPSWYSFDLSVGYDTGDTPANDYLKNIGIQLVVQNITGKHPAFEYRIGSGGGNPTAFDLLKPNQGRMWSLIVTKTW